eukprot:scaffold28660_cov111-Isochrysis_galbana.AAC.3
MAAVAMAVAVRVGEVMAYLQIFCERGVNGCPHAELSLGLPSLNPHGANRLRAPDSAGGCSDAAVSSLHIAGARADDLPRSRALCCLRVVHSCGSTAREGE